MHVLLLYVLRKKLKCTLIFLLEKLIEMSSNSYGIFSPCKNGVEDGVVGLKLLWACVAYRYKKNPLSAISYSSLSHCCCFLGADLQSACLHT